MLIHRMSLNRGYIRVRRLFLALPAAFLLPVAIWSGTAGAQGSTDLGLEPGDIVHDGVVSAVVPEPGLGVAAHAVMESGADADLMVTTSSSGEVEVDRLEEGDGALVEGNPGPGTGCNDEAWNLITHDHPDGSHRIKWYGTMHWRFNRQTAPSQTTADNAERALKQATSNIVNGFNPCDMVSNIGATAQYEGDADSRVAIGSGGACLEANGGSQVGFGDIDDPETLALACEWFDLGVFPHKIVQADIRMDNRSNWYAPELEPCVDDWSIEAVATHERGHSFGLAHVMEADHPFLTMSTRIGGKCQNSESTLGRGDMLGLRELY